MELKMEQEEVKKILLEWAEKEMPRRFNTIVFSSYGKDVTFIFKEPMKDKKENE